MSNDNFDKISFIFKRRSIRNYEEKRVLDEDIDLLLKASMAGPSAAGKDPWRFIVVKHNSTLKKIAEGLTNGKFIADAPLGIVVCGDINAAHGNEESYMLQDCSAAIENLLLAANELGLGAVWLGVHPREDRIKHIKNIFSLPENIIPVSCIAIGYPANRKEPRTRFKQDYVHYDKW